MFLQDLNRVIDYIEANLDGDISYDELAKLMALSVYEFRRIFSFMTGTPVSEYVRCRRLTKAVFDLQRSELSITEIAGKYGYDSPSSFSRAFRDMQGVSPSEARNFGVVLKTYPKLSFRLTVEGADDISFRLVKRGDFRIIGYKGVSFDTETGCCDDIWAQFFDGGSDSVLSEGGYYCEPLNQLARYYNVGGGSVSCMIGAELSDGKQPDERLEVETIPASLWAVFSVTGATSEQINSAYAHILTEWLPDSDFVRDSELPNLEGFPTGGNEDTADMRWDIWYPIKNKNN